MHIVYNKICVICNKNYKALKISTLYCSKRCANRSRSLPTRLKESIIRRAQQFTMSSMDRAEYLESARDYRPPNATKDNPLGDDLGLLIAAAKEEARKRGITVPIDMEDNLKFIYASDPANQGSDGFSIGSDNDDEDGMTVVLEENQDVNTTQSNSNGNSNSDGNDNKDIVDISTERLASGGIRKIGGLKL